MEAADGLDPGLIAHWLPPLRFLRAYCRLRVDGIEHIPPQGAVLAANHTGWLGLDYSNLAIAVHDGVGRTVRGVVHPLWFAYARIGQTVRRLGLAPAKRATLHRLLRAGHLVVVFPEAEQGAFKATVEKQYRLAPFRRGFLRAAIRARVPIVPVAILGGEEANPVKGNVGWTQKFLGLRLPKPTNLLPYPVKWRISFLRPIPTVGFKPALEDDLETMDRLARRIRARISREIAKQRRKRGGKYL